jgi:hypothetical protein
MRAAKIYRFGYSIDKSVLWKSDGIKSNIDFRHIASDVLIDPERNRFQNIWLWADVDENASFGPLYGSVGNNFMKIVLTSQEDSVSTNVPPRVIFRDLKLLSAVPSPPPPNAQNGGGPAQYQLLSFYFDRGEVEN